MRSSLNLLTTPVTLCGPDRNARVEFVFLDTGCSNAHQVKEFLNAWYGTALRYECNTFPPQHQFEPGEIRWHVDLVSRIVPNSGRAFWVNFLMKADDIQQTIRPVRFATLLQHPIARIHREFVAFQRDVKQRGGNADTVLLARDIVRFADAFRRNNFLARFFSRTDVCDPLDRRALARARDALATIDVVGVEEEVSRFVCALLDLDVFLDGGPAGACDGLRAAAGVAATGGGGVHRLTSWTELRLAWRNRADLALYAWAKNLAVSRNT